MTKNSVSSDADRLALGGYDADLITARLREIWKRPGSETEIPLVLVVA